MFGTDKSKLYLPQQPLVEEIDVDYDLIIENEIIKEDSEIQIEKLDEGLTKNLPSGYHTVHTISYGYPFSSNHIKSHGNDLKSAIKHAKHMNKIRTDGVDEKGNFVHKMGSAETHVVMVHDGKGNFRSVDNKGRKTHLVVNNNSTKLTKEEFENLKEISKKTLGSYVSKASRDLGASRQIAGVAFTKKDQHPEGSKENELNHESGWYHTDIARKRQKGIDKAVKRLTREEIEKIEKTLNELNESSSNLPHPFRSDLHRRKTENGHDVIYHHITGVKDPKIAKMGHVDTSKGPGKYTAHDENGKQISDSHHDIYGALKSIAQHHIKNGNGKKFSLE